MGLVGRSVLWALSWAIGVGAGVAGGAYLSAVSGAGAPGVQSLDNSDLVNVPLMAAAAVFVVALVLKLVVGAVVTRFRSAK